MSEHTSVYLARPQQGAHYDGASEQLDAYETYHHQRQQQGHTANAQPSSHSSHIKPGTTENSCGERKSQTTTTQFYGWSHGKSPNSKKQYFTTESTS